MHECPPVHHWHVRRHGSSQTFRCPPSSPRDLTFFTLSQDPLLIALTSIPAAEDLRFAQPSSVDSDAPPQKAAAPRSTCHSRSLASQAWVWTSSLSGRDFTVFRITRVPVVRLHYLLLLYTFALHSSTLSFSDNPFCHQASHSSLTPVSYAPDVAHATTIQ